MGAEGRAVRGFVPHGHWQTLTFLGALRCDSLIAPCVFDGPINGECFGAYVERIDMNDDANFTKRMGELVKDGYIAFDKFDRRR
jgi:hypothetical protein